MGTRKTSKARSKTGAAKRAGPKSSVDGTAIRVNHSAEFQLWLRAAANGPIGPGRYRATSMPRYSGRIQELFAGFQSGLSPSEFAHFFRPTPPEIEARDPIEEAAGKWANTRAEKGAT